ncbi:MAG: hypothetical protein IJ629_02115 [Clostridia bacterium]|nr:hypothetical protein [Clostridia bacterium]
MENFVNTNIYSYLKYYLKKYQFDKKDLESVSKISLSSEDISGKFISNSLEDLKNFENLLELSLSKYLLNGDNLDIISRLNYIEKYTFQDCEFQDNIKLSGDRVNLYHCQGVHHIEFNDFKNIYFENIDLKNLKIKCQYLKLSYCQNLNQTNLICDKIEIKKMDLNKEDIDYIQKIANYTNFIKVATDDKDAINYLNGYANIEIGSSLSGENVG